MWDKNLKLLHKMKMKSLLYMECLLVSLLEYFLHPLGPLVLVYSFPIEKSSEGFFVRESTAKSGLIDALICIYISKNANRRRDDGMWPFATFTLQLHLMQIFCTCHPPLKINTVSNYLSCQAALSALAAHAIEPGEAERQVLGIILGQGQQMTDDDYLQWVVESQRFSLPKEMAEFPSS
ncbi:unnamed protein product, partial [Vitis vinifera]